MYSFFSMNHLLAAGRGFLLMVSLCLVKPVYCQQRLPEHKLSPGLLQSIKSGLITGKTRFIITVSGKTLPAEIISLQAEKKKIKDFGAFTFIEIRVTLEELVSKVLFAREVIFVEDASRKPREEVVINNLDLSANKINLVHRKFPQWNGSGIIVSIKEEKPDTADIDFRGRYLTTNLESPFVSGHASIMATMIAGGGNTWHLGKGVAWGSTISSSDFATLLPDANAAYQQYNISVQNHSYGVGIENFYGADAAAYDATTISNPSLMHVFSSGNSGASSSTTGMYSGISGFANLTGSFKMAKNIVVVGATDSFGVVAALSSKGPAYDGRVVPELVAFGIEGSSGSAALVSGTAVVLQHIYKQVHGSLPASSLIKSALINSADDVGNKEVDYSNGYGSLNALKAVKTLQSGRFINGTISQFAKQVFTVSVPSGIKKLKVTLVWNDPPAAPNATKALVNDLDLELIHPTSGQTWKPWVLNKYPHLDSLNQSARRMRDSLNNVEQVTLEHPEEGSYEFHISGFNVNTSSQDFHLTYQFDSIDVFEWNFPTRNDFIFSSTSNTIRWTASLRDSTGLLEYSLNDGVNWQTIENNLNLTNGYYRWQTPSSTSHALLRMTVNGSQFISDSFTISMRTATGVGFNCPDSFLIHWNKIAGISTYRIYKLGTKYLEPISISSQNFIVLPKNNNPALHYAVAPLIDNSEGMKSYTFNYTQQGVGCYIRSFLSSLLNTSASLDILLGTLYGIKAVVLEKFDGTTYQTLQRLTTPGVTFINFIDQHLKKGLNIYRIKLELEGGGVVYSQPETVYYFSGNEFIIYPNPVQHHKPVIILADDTFEPVTLQVVNIRGQKIYEMSVEERTTTLPTGRFNKGLYFFQFIRNGKKNVVLKVVVH